MKARTLILMLVAIAVAAAFPAAAVRTNPYTCRASGSELHHDDMNASGSVSTEMSLQGTCTPRLGGGPTYTVSAWGWGTSRFQVLNYDGQPDPSIYWRRGVTLELRDQTTGAVSYTHQVWESQGILEPFLVTGSYVPRSRGFGQNVVDERLGCEPSICYSFVAYNWTFTW